MAAEHEHRADSGLGTTRPWCSCGNWWGRCTLDVDDAHDQHEGHLRSMRLRAEQETAA